MIEPSARSCLYSQPARTSRQSPAPLRWDRRESVDELLPASCSECDSSKGRSGRQCAPRIQNSCLKNIRKETGCPRLKKKFVGDPEQKKKPNLKRQSPSHAQNRCVKLARIENSAKAASPPGAP